MLLNYGQIRIGQRPIKMNNTVITEKRINTDSSTPFQPIPKENLTQSQDFSSLLDDSESQITSEFDSNFRDEF